MPDPDHPAEVGQRPRLSRCFHELTPEQQSFFFGELLKVEGDGLTAAATAEAAAGSLYTSSIVLCLTYEYMVRACGATDAHRKGGRSTAPPLMLDWMAVGDVTGSLAEVVAGGSFNTLERRALGFIVCSGLHFTYLSILPNDHHCSGNKVRGRGADAY